MILSNLIFIPLIGALTTSILSKFIKKRSIFIIASIFAFIELLMSYILWSKFDVNIGTMQFTEDYRILNDPFSFIRYTLGIDGISLYFIILTTLLIPICIILSYSSIQKNFGMFVSLFLLMESIIIAVFCLLDFILFYIAFEAVLIPMYIIIGVWGGENRVYAAFKFFIYTLFGSVFMLIAVLFIVFQVNDANITTIHDLSKYFSESTCTLLWLGFFIAFAIKIPMFPFHTWLPDAHVQAPTAGSVILAGVLIKMGGYGFIRVLLPMLPIISKYAADFVIILSIVAIIYTSLVALVQEDMKKMIAYSSVAHMGYVTAGLFTFSSVGINGALIQMISHGVISSALFIVVGALYNRMHTKAISFYGGLTNRMPKLAFWFMIFTMGSVALPGTSGFVGEIMILIATFKYNVVYGTLMTLGMVLCAAYMLLLYKKIMFGELKKNVINIHDLVVSEKLIFIVLGIWVMVIGLYPKLITDFTSKSVINLLSIS